MDIQNFIEYLANLRDTSDMKTHHVEWISVFFPCCGMVVALCA